MRAIYLTALAVIFHSPFAQGAEPDYGAWRKANPSGEWTREAEAAVVAAGLPALKPSDIDAFCPDYGQANEAERTRFWAGLLSVMARPESNFKPQLSYKEPGMDNVVSRGLLQISIKSANQSAYKCEIKDDMDLHDPAVNIRCGAKIMAHLVASDGNIASTKKPPRGAARYWSVLQAWRGHMPEITAFTRALPVCKAK